MAGVNVDINARIDRTFSNSLERATRDLTRFQTNAQSVGRSLGGIFSGLAAGLGLFSFDAIIKNSITAADNLRDLSKTTGIAVTQLSGLKLAASSSGTDLEDVATSINKLSVNIAKNGDKFKQLGIDAKDPLEAFKQLSDLFVSIDDPQQRAALGAFALGKSWQNTAPLLAEGSKSISEMVEKGRRFSGITEEMADSSDKLNDKLEELRARLQGVITIIAGPAINVFLNLSEFIEKTNRSASGGAQAFSIYQFAINSAAKVAAAAIDIFNRAGLGIGALAAKAQALATFDFKGFNAIDKAFSEDIKKSSKTYDDFVKKLESPVKLAKTDSPAKDATAELKRLEQIKKVIGTSEDKPKSVARRSTSNVSLRADNRAQQEAERITESLNQQIKSTEKLIALRGESSNIAKTEFELFGKILDKNEDIIRLTKGDRNQDQKIKLLNLAAEVDALDRQDEKWKQLIADANEFDELKERISELSIDPEINLDKFNSGIAEIQNRLRDGIISDEQAKGLFDTLGKGFNEGFVSPSITAFDTISTFADQAARNIQDSFADFLFDPFKNGTEGMLTTFRKILAQMASELIVSQISKAAKGFDWGGLASSIVGVFGGAVGSIAGAASSVASQTGGIITEGFAKSFSGFKGFASGGDFPGGIRLVGEQGPELELTGASRIFSANQTQEILSGRRNGMTNNITINVAAPNGRIDPQSLTQVRAGLERSLAQSARRNN